MLAGANLVRSGFGDWQREAEPRSLAEVALDPDATAVRIDDSLGDEEPESGPLLE